jgi:hypothetical protein
MKVAELMKHAAAIYHIAQKHCAKASRKCIAHMPKLNEPRDTPGTYVQQETDPAKLTPHGQPRAHRP